jgi:hypothetical protein
MIMAIIAAASGPDSEILDCGICQATLAGTEDLTDYKAECPTGSGFQGLDLQSPESTNTKPIPSKAA